VSSPGSRFFFLVLILLYSVDLFGGVVLFVVTPPLRHQIHGILADKKWKIVHRLNQLYSLSHPPVIMFIVCLGLQKVSEEMLEDSFWQLMKQRDDQELCVFTGKLPCHSCFPTSDSSTLIPEDKVYIANCIDKNWCQSAEIRSWFKWLVESSIGCSEINVYSCACNLIWYVRNPFLIAQQICIYCLYIGSGFNVHLTKKRRYLNLIAVENENLSD
jgi:hypothetical protein